jgi:phosphatidate cytidylyltransferase
MKQRFLTGAIIILVLVPIFIFSDTILLNIVLSILSVWGMVEFFQTSEYPERKAMAPICLLFAAAMPFSPLFLLGEIRGEVLLLFALLIVLLIIMIFHPGKYCLENAGVIFLMTVLVSILFTCILFTRRLPFGLYYMLLIFIGAWFSDAFALFCGTLFGKHKLAPLISPKKTVEGYVGGVVFGGIFFLLFGVLVQNLSDVRVNFPALLFAGICAALIGQLGDLAFSLLKRHFHIKDFGRFMPGHGGILDRFDSILFVSPVIYLFGSFSTIFM